MLSFPRSFCMTLHRHCWNSYELSLNILKYPLWSVDRHKGNLCSFAMTCRKHWNKCCFLGGRGIGKAKLLFWACLLIGIKSGSPHLSYHFVNEVSSQISFPFHLSCFFLLSLFSLPLPSPAPPLTFPVCQFDFFFP